MSKIINVAAAIIYDLNGKILICQRDDSGNCANLWEFPGGKCNPQENMEECLFRECREELDVDIEVLGLFDELTYEYPDRTIHFKFFRARIRSGTPRLIVHEDMKWVLKREMEKYAFCPADHGVVEKLLKSV